MAKGIKDKVVILGMGCSKFGERWDKEADNLMVEAYTEAVADAGIDSKQIDAAWLATAMSLGMTTNRPSEIFMMRVSAAFRFCPMIGISVADPTRLSRISAIFPRKLASAERISITSAASAASPDCTAFCRCASSSW